MKLGVYVGSFDPVHKGHIEVVRYLLKEKYVDKIIIVPTGSYWDKNKQTDIKNRIEMLKYYEEENIIIDTENNNLPYTYQVLDKLKDKYKEGELYLIIGNDLIESFNKWKNVDEILKNKVIVIHRNNIDNQKYINNFRQKDRFITVANTNFLEVSSTLVRNGFYNKDKGYLLNYIDEDIYNYILNNKLYKF